MVDHHSEMKGREKRWLVMTTQIGIKHRAVREGERWVEIEEGGRKEPYYLFLYNTLAHATYMHSWSVKV